MKPKNTPLNFTRPTFKIQFGVNPLELVPKAKLPDPVPNKSVDHKMEQLDVSMKFPPKQKIIQKTQPTKFNSYKTKMCPEGRDCKNYKNCKFAHTQQQLRRPFYKRTKQCKLYQRGMCSLGNACRQYHGNIVLKGYNQNLYKTQKCQDFQKGNCPLGNICTKAHGQQQLNALINVASQKPKQAQVKQKQKTVIKLVGYEGRRRNYKMQIVEQTLQQQQRRKQLVQKEEDQQPQTTKIQSIQQNQQEPKDDQEQQIQQEKVC